MTLYRGFHIVLDDGRYSVFTTHSRDGYVGRKGSFNTAKAARAWVRELIRAQNSQEDA